MRYALNDPSLQWATIHYALPHVHIIIQVFQSHTRSDNYLADFCDGSLFNNHSFFQAHPDALQLIMYFDEIEVCNPLGSHAGVHKLGNMFNNA